RAQATIGAFAGEIQENFFPLSTLLNAADLLAKPLQVVVVGKPGAADTEALLRTVATAASLPNLVLQILAPEAALPTGHPADGKGMVGGKASVYVCEGPVCSLPFTDPAALAEDLKAR